MAISGKIWCNHNEEPLTAPCAGYSQGSANIWRAIYEENCFKPPVDRPQHQLDSGHGMALPSLPLGCASWVMQLVAGLCFEERVFYRLISGLHASVSVHIAEFWEQDTSGLWKHNSEEFWRRVGNHPDRIRNLLFTYLFLLRAAYRFLYSLISPFEILSCTKNQPKLIWHTGRLPSWKNTTLIRAWPGKIRIPRLSCVNSYMLNVPSFLPSLSYPFSFTATPE